MAERSTPQSSFADTCLPLTLVHELSHYVGTTSMYWKRPILHRRALLQ